MPPGQAFLGIDANQPLLDRGRSGQPASHVWFVDFNVVREGLPIEGARVVFRVNNGNLVQYGTENLPAPCATVPPPKLSQSAALVRSKRGGRARPWAPATSSSGASRRGTRSVTRAAFTCCRPTSPATRP